MFQSVTAEGVVHHYRVAKLCGATISGGFLRYVDITENRK